jgi:hypothetical protein
MTTSILKTVESHEADRPDTTDTGASEKPSWETPKMEDVSEQVMAQPYIRFT